MRARTGAYASLLVGGGLGLAAAAQPWWRAVGEGVAVGISGTQSTGGLAQALAVVVLAGTLLILALQSRGRRLVGTSLLAVGAGLVLVGLLRLRPSADAVRAQVRQSSLTDQFALQATPWGWVYAGAGALVVLGAALTAVTAGRWPSRPDRFTRAAVAPRGVTAADEAIDVWKALDAGVDPTAPVDPDVHRGGPGDRMAGVDPLGRAGPPAQESPRSVE